ncbi:MAG: membrane receptor protein [Gammaproteobacteria bacterium]|nr:membrane receptor protein [Gammaproteobacteria bacterium]
MINKNYLSLYLVAFSLSAFENSWSQDEVENNALDEIFVIGSNDAVRNLAGSATFIDAEEIKEFDDTDLTDLLTRSPGIYIRSEDGYGLRPNIGIRGAAAERSQKIVIMEDGILISPAPYSAPAAYYLPNVNRMSAVEVMKGPASIQYGPHTVGGALNLVTQPISLDQQGMLEAVFGSDDYQKYRASYKDQIGQFAYSVDLLRYSANGFKDLDEGGDTGFVRNDLNIKVEWNSAETATYQQKLQFKMGYADEDSNETYLGLTDADLKATPDRRYISSKLDRFVSDHTQAHLLHSIKLNSDLSFFTKAYVNRFDRSWNKFDGLIGGPSANTALARPDVFTTEIALLRGEIDSSEAGSQLIDVTNNDRKYGSQGIEVSLNYDYAFGAWQHNFQGGVRFHNDYVDRDHHQRGYSVVNKNLIFDGINSRTKKALNNASTDATAFYLNDRIDIGQWTLNTGIRIENIQGEYQDFLNDSIATNNQTVVIPGFGAHWQWRDDLGFFVGVNSGFSPAAPTAGSEAESEKSTNFEYGLRYNSDYNIEMVGFYSDYSNLIGRCRVSDPNCIAGQEFSAGDVDIAGAELSGSRVFEMKNGWIVPIEFAYTYTESAFQNSFLSSFSQWGNVVSGDELPYLPKHNARLQIGIENHQFSFNAALRYVSEMREIAGQGVFEEGNFTPKHTIIDMSASWFVNDDWRFQLVAENITNKRVIVARRPIGARPTAPSLIRLGVQYQF